MQSPKPFLSSNYYLTKEAKIIQTKNRILDLAVRKIQSSFLVDPLAVAMRNHLR